MKRLIEFLLIFFIVACGKNVPTSPEPTPTPTPTPSPSPTASITGDDFDGYHYFLDGGFFELNSDPDKKVDLLSSTVYFYNSDNTQAAFTLLAATALDVVNSKVITKTAVATAASVLPFKANVSGSSLALGTLMPQAAPNVYRANQVFTLNSDKSITLTLNIYHQATATSPYSLVYTSTITTYK